MTELLIDTSVLIALLKDELQEDTERFLFSQKASISVITYVETCRFFALAGKIKEWDDTRARFSDFELLPVTRQIGEMAAKNAVENRLALADSVIYATAQAHGLTLATKDKEFKGLKNVLIVK